jgi:hypothetical protein
LERLALRPSDEIDGASPIPPPCPALLFPFLITAAKFMPDVGFPNLLKTPQFAASGKGAAEKSNPFHWIIHYFE